MKQAAFKALFTAESMETYEKKDPKNIFRPAKALIKSACEDDEPHKISSAIPPKPFKILTREFHLSHDLFLESLWGYSIYANDPSITSPEAFNNKMEELTTYRLGAGLKGLETDIPDLNSADGEAGKYDKIIIHYAIVDVFLRSVETLRTGCESCPSCLEEAEKKRALAEKRAMVQRNVAEALRRRAEEEGGNTPQTPTPSGIAAANAPPALEESEDEEEDIQEMRCEKCSFRIGSHTMEESIACGLIPVEVVVEVSATPTPVVSAIPLAVGVGGVSPQAIPSPQSAEDAYFALLKKQLETGKKENIPLPLTEIDEIPVRVVVEFNNHSKHLHLRIYLAANQSYYDPNAPVGHDETVLYNYYTGHEGKVFENGEDIERIIQQVKLIMDGDECWFDKYHGLFYVGKTDIEKMKTTREANDLFGKAFKGKKGRKMTSRLNKECSVCYEPTQGRTECGHPLCLNCLVGIDAEFNNPVNEYEFGDDPEEVPCPCCRQDITFGWRQ